MCFLYFNSGLVPSLSFLDYGEHFCQPHKNGGLDFAGKSIEMQNTSQKLDGQLPVGLQNSKRKMSYDFLWINSFFTVQTKLFP